jgi:hypothetical protein
VVSRSKRIFGRIKRELSDVELCKDMLVILPTEHILRGFLIEATIEKGRIYLWRVITPLHRPMRHVILDYSDRILPESGEDILLKEDNFQASLDLIRPLIIKHMNYLQSVRRPVDFLRHIDWMIGNQSAHFLLDLALTYFRVGRRRESSDILRKLAQEVDQEERTSLNRFRLNNPLDEDIRQAARVAQDGPEQLASLLDQWEMMNVETLGLQVSRQLPSGVAAEARGSIS